MSLSDRPNPLFYALPRHDGDYVDEQTWRRRRRRRRRLDLSDNERLEAARAVRYPGDGLDFRTPVMSASSSAGPPRAGEEVNDGVIAAPAFIDLTDEDANQESQASEDGPAAAPVASSSRAQRLPRFARSILDEEDSPGGETSDSDTSRLPGASYLALPPQWARSNRDRRPHFSSLRRPAWRPSPPPAMDEDEVEFVGERTLQNAASRQPTPQALASARNAPRSVTPYPAGVTNTVIDLTAEGDDDVVLINARQRVGNNNEGGPNVAHPVATATRDYGHLGQIANILREGGAHLGGRLMQRLNGFGLEAINADARAMAQARDHYEYNNARHPPHRNNAERGEVGHIPGALPRLPRLPGPMPIMMDYTMTAFDLAVPGGNRPPTPKYDPPPAPEPGFTRSPEEDEVVVCPNCGDELAVGEGDMKQEIWIIKTCGHAYCGECAQNRAIKTKTSKKGGKGKGRAYSTLAGETAPTPFKACVVDGCGKPAAKNSMIKLYLA